MGLTCSTEKTSVLPNMYRISQIAIEAAARVATNSQGVKLLVSSSKTNTDPPMGALKATARPAPAPAASITFRSSSCRTTKRPTKEPSEAPICTVGPSRPSARPDPIASKPPKNLIRTIECGAGFTSPLNTASTLWTPLPSADGAKRTTRSRARAAPNKPKRERREPANVRPSVRPKYQQVTQVVGSDEEVAEGAADDSDQNSRENAGRSEADHARIQELHGRCPLATAPEAMSRSPDDEFYYGWCRVASVRGRPGCPKAAMGKRSPRGK